MLLFAYYLLKVVICSGILFGYYWLMLRNKVFHQYNRFYLLAIVVLSLALPVIKVNIWHAANMPAPQAIQLLQVVNSSNDYLDEIIVTSKQTTFSTEQYLALMYSLITFIFLCLFTQTIFRIRTLFKKHQHSLVENIYFVNTTAKGTPFSFLRYIFWNDHIDPESTTGHQIFKHELAHVQQKHSYDKLFINAMLIFYWCNPVFWLIRKELNMIHEFVADKIAVEDSDTETFAAMILQATYPQHRFHLTNPFFYSPIKRRLLMLTKNKNPKVGYIGRIFALPLTALIFAAFTLKAKPFKKSDHPVYNGKKITVVIDAGHGGSDNGAISIDGSIKEKDLTLAIIKKIKALNSNSNIKLVFTRENDVYQTVKQKADFTKEQNADLFVSIHIAGTTNEAANSKTGMLVYVAKDNFVNSAGSKLFASALINEFKNDFPLFVSDLPQQREVGIMVLQESPCPAVLIEAGYITNKNDLVYLKTDAGKEKIATNILAAIEKFANVKQKNGSTTEIILDSKPLTSGGIYVNTKHTDSNYLKSDLFKNNALIIVDSKEIGNLGMNYIEKNIAAYSTIVIYSPAEAQKIYGNNGRYGILALTVKDAIFISSDTFVVDDDNNSLKIRGNKTVINGDLSNSLIYIDGKISTPAEMNAIPPAKISSINILKGEKLDDIIDAKGKTASISVQLKPNDLPEVVVQSTKPSPLYVVDGEIKALNYNLENISPDEIESVNVIKGKDALTKYGEAAKNGVVEINTKSGKSKPAITHEKTTSLNQIVVVGYGTGQKSPLYVVDGEIKALDYNLASISPDEIETVNVIKGENALTKYGEAAKNGVVEINTKSGKSKPAITHEKTTSLNEIVVVGYGTGQNIPNGADNRIFTTTENQPTFPGGDSAWAKYLQKNINANLPREEGWKAGIYKITVSFIVRIDGTIADLKTSDYPGSLTAEHCIDLIRKGPRWKPAIQNGHAVNAYRKQPISFVIEKETITML